MEEEKEFVPYELTLRLKNLGFSGRCLAFYKDFTEKWVLMMPTQLPAYELDNLMFSLECKSLIEAPTFSQAFRWFREEYNLYHNIRKGFGFFSANIILEEDRHDLMQDKTVPHHLPQYFDNHKTYEDAELACLERLIEIVESEKG